MTVYILFDIQKSKKAADKLRPFELRIAKS